MINQWYLKSKWTDTPDMPFPTMDFHFGRKLKWVVENSLCNLGARGPAQKIVQNDVGTSVASLVPIFYKIGTMARAAVPPFPHKQLRCLWGGIRWLIKLAKGC